MKGSIRRRGRGYSIIYRDAGGKQIWESVGASEREARKLLRHRVEAVEAERAIINREKARGAYIEPADETLEEYGRPWLKRKEAELAPSTIAGYRSFLNGEVFPRLGDRPLVALRPADFSNLVAELKANGRPAGSIRNALVPVRSILSDAVDAGLLASNPARRPKNLPTPPQSGGREIPEEHLSAIRAALVALAPAEPLRKGERDLLAPLAFDLALATGLRLSELIALRWQACEFSDRSVQVSEAIVRGQSKLPKSGKTRTVPMFDTARVALRALATRALDRGRYAPDEFVLSTARGTPLHPSNWNRRVWRPAVTKAELDGLGYRWHDLRHCTVSRLVAQRADIAVVQAVAGHASASTTLDVYTHLTDKRLENAALEFDPGLALLAKR